MRGRHQQAVPGIAGKPAEELRSRLEHELRIIADLGFAPYFLTVAEVSHMILDMGIRSAARGSGASSLVNYLTGISQVNPCTHDLLFERFLSRDRATLPDIDIDVESAQRHNIYQKIFTRFGSDRVSLMSMQNGYRARGAVRDAGQALGMEEEDIDDIAKQLWRFSASSFRDALNEKPELQPSPTGWGSAAPKNNSTCSWTSPNASTGYRDTSPCTPAESSSPTTPSWTEPPSSPAD